MNVLIVCTTNSCASQMAEAWLKNINPEINVHSSGVSPKEEMNPLAVKAMMDQGIDISNRKPTHVNNYINEDWDYIMTISDFAKENLPEFKAEVKNRIHYVFDDPTKAEGDEDFVLSEYKRVSLDINHTMFFMNDVVFKNPNPGCNSTGCSCSNCSK